jgi:hypothetical protein
MLWEITGSFCLASGRRSTFTFDLR